MQKKEVLMSEPSCDCQRDCVVSELFINEAGAIWLTEALHVEPRQALCVSCFLAVEVVATSLPQLARLHHVVRRVFPPGVSEAIIHYVSSSDDICECLAHGSVQIIKALVPSSHLATRVDAWTLIFAAQRLQNPELLRVVDMIPILTFETNRMHLSSSDLNKEVLDYFWINRPQPHSERDLVAALLPRELTFPMGLVHCVMLAVSKRYLETTRRLFELIDHCGAFSKAKAHGLRSVVQFISGGMQFSDLEELSSHLRHNRVTQHWFLDVFGIGKGEACVRYKRLEASRWRLSQFELLSLKPFGQSR